jgi:hypothetical protein
MTNKLGRPQKEINWEVLNGILQYGASLVDCAEMLDVSEDTIERKIKDQYAVTFKEYRDQKKSKMRMKLRQKQFEMALKGNVPLLIWLGKNELGQTDKAEIAHELSKIQITIDEQDRDL